MVWTINRIEAENFMGFRRLDLDLTKYRGITSIEGSRGAPGTSNGASKSTILEAIHWCLKGRLMRKHRLANKVMHRWMKPDDRTFVRLTIDVDGSEAQPERSRTRSAGALRLFEQGKSSTMDGVQEKLDRLLGLPDDRALTSTAIFSGAMAQFCSMTDAERKAALERMVGADHYGAASKLAAERLVAAEAEGATQDRIAADRAADIANALAERQREVARCIGASAAQESVEKGLRRAVVRASVAADEAHRLLGEHHTSANEARRVYEAARAALVSREAVAVARRGELDRDIAAAEQACAVGKAGIDAVRRERAALAEDTHPDNCAHCGQRWPQKGLTKAALEKALRAKDDRILEAKSLIAPHEARAAAARQERDVVISEAKRAVAERAALEATLDDRAERRLLTAAIHSESVLAAAMDELRRHRDTMPEPEGGGIVVDCAAIDARIEALRAARQAALDAATDARAMGRRLAFWKKGFGRQGMPSYLLDSSIPALNETVGRLASSLSNGELAVSFDPAAAKGSGDVFAVNVEYANGGDDYDMSSTGEHARVDIAVMFALRDLVEARGSNRCTQLFMDETFQGTDPAFADAVMAMLRAHYGNRDIFIISHDDSVKALCDNTIVVRKAGREAVVA